MQSPPLVIHKKVNVGLQFLSLLLYSSPSLFIDENTALDTVLCEKGLSAVLVNRHFETVDSMTLIREFDSHVILTSV